MPEQIRRLLWSVYLPDDLQWEFNVLTVTGPPIFQTKVEAAIEEFDVPPAAKNIELTIYVVTTDTASPVAKELEAIRETVHGRWQLQRHTIDGHPGDPNPPRSAWQIRRYPFARSLGQYRRERSRDQLNQLKVNLKAATMGADIDIPRRSRRGYRKGQPGRPAGGQRQSHPIICWIYFSSFSTFARRGRG